MMPRFSIIIQAVCQGRDSGGAISLPSPGGVDDSEPDLGFDLPRSGSRTVPFGFVGNRFCFPSRTDWMESLLAHAGTVRTILPHRWGLPASISWAKRASERRSTSPTFGVSRPESSSPAILVAGECRGDDVGARLCCQLDRVGADAAVCGGAQCGPDFDIGRHTLGRRTDVAVFEPPLGPEADLDILIAVGGYCRAAWAAFGDIDDPEPDFWFGMVVSSAAQSGSQQFPGERASATLSVSI